jgi:hypothetical protein
MFGHGTAIPFETRGTRFRFLRSVGADMGAAMGQTIEIFLWLSSDLSISFALDRPSRKIRPLPCPGRPDGIRPSRMRNDGVRRGGVRPIDASDPVQARHPRSEGGIGRGAGLPEFLIQLLTERRRCRGTGARGGLRHRFLAVTLNFVRSLLRLDRRLLGIHGLACSEWWQQPATGADLDDNLKFDKRKY